MELTFTSCMYFRTPISVTKKETGNFDLKIRKKSIVKLHIYIYLKRDFCRKKRTLCRIVRMVSLGCDVLRFYYSAY